MASVASQLIEEVTAHAQSDSLEDAREICADGTYFPNKLRNSSYKLTANKTHCLLGDMSNCLSSFSHMLLSIWAIITEFLIAVE